MDTTLIVGAGIVWVFVYHGKEDLGYLLCIHRMLLILISAGVIFTSEGDFIIALLTCLVVDWYAAHVSGTTATFEKSS